SSTSHGSLHSFPTRRSSDLCGLPAVAADAQGVPDILEGGETSGGLVVPRDNEAALALALGRVLDDEVWSRELGKHARRRVEACLDRKSTRLNSSHDQTSYAV